MNHGRLRRIVSGSRAVPAAIALASMIGSVACGGSETLLGGVDGDDASTVDDGAVPTDDGTSPVDDGGGTTPPPPADGGLGDTGWRDSTEPWTPPAREPERACDAFDVWSNDLAVYVLMNWRDTDGGPPSDVGQQVMVNDGTGWREFYSVRSTSAFDCFALGCISGIAGMIDGRLVTESGRLAYVSPAGYEIDPDVPDPVEGVFVVSDALAYATWHSTGARVVHWDGARWGPIPAVLPYEAARRIWADEDDLFVVGEHGTVVSLEGSEWRIHDAGTLADVQAVWGFDGDDVWISTFGNELRHFDGTSWTDVPWPFPTDGADPCREQSIAGLWGADGTLFVWTSNRLAAWDGSGFRSLGHWPSRTVVEGTITYCRGGMWISAVWGNAPDEAFVALSANFEDAGRSCPDAFLLYWDGTTFHWF